MGWGRIPKFIAQLVSKSSMLEGKKSMNCNSSFASPPLKGCLQRKGFISLTFILIQLLSLNFEMNQLKAQIQNVLGCIREASPLFKGTIQVFNFLFSFSVLQNSNKSSFCSLRNEHDCGCERGVFFHSILRGIDMCSLRRRIAQP